MLYGFSPPEASACDVPLKSQRPEPGFDAWARDVVAAEEWTASPATTSRHWSRIAGAAASLGLHWLEAAGASFTIG